ncbi:hypothetical protein SCA6_000980 [Theobroma cacao]
MSTQFLINDEKLKYVLATIAVTVSREQQFPKGKHSLKMIAVPSLKGESFLLCISGASINDKIATDCLKHDLHIEIGKVKSDMLLFVGTLGGCMICETMLTVVGKTFPAHFKKGLSWRGLCLQWEQTNWCRKTLNGECYYLSKWALRLLLPLSMLVITWHIDHVPG